MKVINPLGMSLICLVVATASSAAACYSAHSYKNAMINEQVRLDLECTENRQRYTDTQKSRIMYEKYHDRFLKYQNEGLFGKEERIEWAKILEHFSAELRLPLLRYEIEPQRNIELVGTRPVAGVEVKASSMKITADILHEGDLLDLLNRLETHTTGNFSVKKCKLTSEAYRESELRYKPEISYVNMICHLDWYTVEISS